MIRDIVRPPKHGGTWALLLPIGLCAAIEAALQLADAGLLLGPSARLEAYRLGAVWPAPAPGWFPLYPGQGIAMTLTYGLLHGGLSHLALNMAGLWVFGAAAIERVGPRRFLALLLGTTLSGALVFLVLATRGQPMVGISGALFGLVGALLAWSWEDATGLRARLRAIAPDLAILLLLGLGAHVLLAGQIAWQTHLGGFLGGWVLGIALDRPPGAPANRASRERSRD